MAHDHAVQKLLQTQDFVRLDLDVRSLALRAAQRLMKMDGRIRQRIALAFRACQQQHGAETGRHPNRGRADRRLDHLHGVVDGQTRGHLPARRVDVEVDVLLRVLAVQEQQLGHDDVGNLIVDRGAQKDDAVAQQQRVDVKGAFASPVGLDDHGHHGASRVGRKL